MSIQQSPFSTDNLFMLGDTIVIELVNLHEQLEKYRKNNEKRLYAMLANAIFTHLYNEFNFKNFNYSSMMIGILEYYDDCIDDLELEIAGFEIIFGSDHIFIQFERE